MTDDLLYYDMPPIRCMCNKPIGHLYETYQQLIEMNHSMEDVYECIGLVNYCCRKEIANGTRTILKSCVDYKMKDCPETHKLDNYKKISEKITIVQENSTPRIPLQLTTRKTVKTLSDTLYINYIKKCDYLAQ